MEKVVLDAKFEKRYFDTEKKTIQDEIRSTQDNIARYANIFFLKTLYQDHPYSLEPAGTIASVEELSRDKIISLYKELFVPENMVISVVGDLDEKLVFDWIDRLLSGLSPRKFIPPLIKKMEEQLGPRCTKFTKETKQAHFLLAHLRLR
jgi:zinc protease